MKTEDKEGALSQGMHDTAQETGKDKETDAPLASGGRTTAPVPRFRPDSGLLTSTTVRE